MRTLSYRKLCFLVLGGCAAAVFLLKNSNSYNLIQKESLNDETIRLKLNSIRSTKPALHQKNPGTIVISFVVCNTRFNESLSVVKSVLIFTRSPVYFVIFADENLQPKFNDTLTRWRTLTKNQLDFELQNIQFPEAHEDDWMNLFSKCAAQRLFIPDLVPHIDSLIYVDTDTLFLGPVEHLWSYFSKFNESQMSAMTLESEDPNLSWYPRFAKHPFYGKCGLNSGMMLMNLTRMREFSWSDYLTPIMLEWKLYLPWGDQDIINIIFHYNAKRVYELSCRYNYRTDHCVHGDGCADATARGVFLLHGSRGAFHTNKETAFEVIYQAINEHDVGKDTPASALQRMETYLSEIHASNCNSKKQVYLKIPTETFTNLTSSGS